MELRDLAYFKAIAEAGHLGRAADQVGRTQPALSKSLRRLEESLDAQLFEREGRGLKLTSVGEALLARASFLQRAFELTLREVGDYARGEAGHIKIGSGATAAEYLLPGITAQLLAQAPGVTLELVIGMSDRLRALLREGEIHLAIVPLASNEPEFEVVEAMEDEVVVVARAGHPLIGRPVQLSDLNDYNWVLPAASVSMREWLDGKFEGAGLPRPIVQVETNSLYLLPRMIAETDLLSFISRKNLGPGTSGAPLLEVDCSEALVRRKIGAVYRKGVYLAPAAHRLIELLGTTSGGAPRPRIERPANTRPRSRRKASDA